MDCVYFVTDGELIKIGTSRQADNRLRGLRSPNGGDIEVIGVIPGDQHVERAFHDALAAYRRIGEWFQDCQEVRDYIAVAMTGAHIPERWTRLTIDVPLDLHIRIKVDSARRGQKMADLVRHLLEREFPKS